MLPFKAKVDEGWAIPSLSADLSVMRRTQKYMRLEKDKRPIQIESYLLVKVAWHILLFCVSVSLLGILVKFSYGRRLLLKYPGVFSAGAFSTTKPSPQKLDSAWFRLTIVGNGWRNKLSNIENRYFQKTDGRIVVRVKARNQSYGATSLCLVLAGIMILTEPENMPKRGGVFTPGAAFCDTSLIQQLDKNGVNFEVIETDDETKLCNGKSKL
ncbi:hypothetical protein WA026_011542 [Henosepilachna vigintioctopunctata]|uniref:Saccharopine dehydrogenase n=1 Tax=Henosepilachna vigintioctopunctata TaxID=420089 RepID=A0AAW1TJR1_9CUCU